MSLQVKVPIRTAVIKANSDCKISGRYEDDALVVRIDTRHQNHHQRLGLRKATRLYWGKTYEYEAQELSALGWPIRYRVLSREGYMPMRKASAFISARRRAALTAGEASPRY